MTRFLIIKQNKDKLRLGSKKETEIRLDDISNIDLDLLNKCCSIKYIQAIQGLPTTEVFNNIVDIYETQRVQEKEIKEK